MHDDNLERPPQLRGPSELPDPKVALASNQMLMLGLMTSRLCDLRCRYCYTAAGHKRPNELPLSARIDLIKQAADMGVQLLWIPGEGEPLLDDGFWPIIEAAARAGIWTLFYTNGTQVTPDLARRAADLPCSVVLKLNSLQASLQDELSGIEGSHVALRRALDYFLATGMATDNRLAAETVVMPQNKDEIPLIFRHCRELGIIPYIERMLAAGRGKQPELQMGEAEEDAVFAALAQIDREEFGYTWGATGMFVGGIWHCDRILYTLVVDSVGDAYPCVLQSGKLGDVRHQQLEEIWNSFDARQLRSSLRQDIGKGKCFCRQSLGQQAQRRSVSDKLTCSNNR